MNSKQYKSVLEMVRDIGPPELAAEVEQQIRSKRIISSLMVARAVKNMSQMDVAREMGTTIDRIKCIEDDDDSLCTLGVLAKYANAVGCTLEVEVVPIPF